MNKKTILLCGGTGMLGKHVFDLLSNTEDICLYTVGRSDQPQIKNYINCDISDIPQFNKVLDKLKPQYVINCAAEVNVNLCEIDKERVYKLHVQTAETIASKTYIIKTIYVSTDSVFDGQKGDYVENDIKNPLNYYAKTKSLAEDIFLNSTQNAIILRTNIIGFKYPLQASLFEWGYKNLSNSKAISGYSNIIFNPLYVKTLAEIIVNNVLLSDIDNGVYHIGCQDYNSKYDFLKKIATTFNFNINLITSTEAPASVNDMLRPLNTSLNINKAEKYLNIKFPSLLQEVLKIQQDLKQVI